MEKEKSNMRKQVLFVVIALLAIAVLIGTPVTADQARQVARNLSLERSGQTYAVGSVDFLNGNPQTHIYLANLQPAGYVLVAGDDAAQPILGYNFTTVWSDDTVPVQLQDMLANWQEQLQYILDNNLAADNYIRSEWSRLLVSSASFVPQVYTRDVSPLIASTWGQGGYYNDLCPSNTPVGCVATAMSQIMKYWNFPTVGQGSHSYVHPVYGTQSADFGATTYNWAGMPNQVGSSNISVATLCYHAGVAVDMDYDPTGSGAYSTAVDDALINYFKYKNTTQLKYKYNYSDANWHTLLQGELTNARPIYYAGSSAGSGGHAFILDGFQATNHYHINWGWDGYYNGYYYLTALNPGGNNFTSNQEAVIGIEPTAGAVTYLNESFEGTAPGWIVLAGDTAGTEEWNLYTGASYAHSGSAMAGIAAG